MFGIFYKPEKINNVETLVGYPAVMISTERKGNENNLGTNYCKVLTGIATDDIKPISRVITTQTDKCSHAFLWLPLTITPQDLGIQI